ncbi:hypothetical protein Q8A67_015810 [Cirrhinus molitorella]|uniref:Uncharacterized protein n=1 Tax=Cirrhinus molitorella TaxID=172907 RepID=A0AA88PJ89_9TELE|nr:hypothetical protein Q8A67_015810 [Cirrhinus molitorella]
MAASRPSSRIRYRLTAEARKPQIPQRHSTCRSNSTTGLNHLNLSHVCPHADTPRAVDAPLSIFIGQQSSVTLRMGQPSGLKM